MISRLSLLVRCAARGRGRGGAALRLAVFLGLLGSLLAIPRFSASAHTTGYPRAPWIIGVSNNLVGNGW
ncbi:MAG TPA: hypothetical protein VKF37_15170, partial [Chloroflexota bacterium]|nr:hypothetical protein [Chloroflexota bacterium]